MIRSLTRLFAFAATFSLCASVAFPAAADVAAPHLTTYAKLRGDYPQARNASWNTVAKYVDYLEVDQRGSDAAHAAGIKVGFYTDIHLICVGNTCSGSPSLDQVPESAIAHGCGGARIYSSDDTDAARKLLTNPNSPQLLRVWNRLIDGKLHNQYGDHREDFVVDDDAFIPKTAYYRWHAGSPRGAVQPQPFCGYQTASYVAGIKHLQAQAHLPVIMNGLNGAEDTPYLVNARNLWGGICEDCLHASYDPKRNHEATPFWNEQLDEALAANAHHKLWIAYPHGDIDLDTQGYVYASLLLIYSGRFTALELDVTTPSGLPLSPAMMLVAHGALQPTPTRIAQLRRPGGTYAREFRHCTISGVAVGACATVVNPDPSAAHPYPFPAGRYRHTLEMTGTGVAHELGDTGALSPHGAAPPAEIPARGWAIVFR